MPAISFERTTRLLPFFVLIISVSVLPVYSDVKSKIEPIATIIAINDGSIRYPVRIKQSQPNDKSQTIPLATRVLDAIT